MSTTTYVFVQKKKITAFELKKKNQLHKLWYRPNSVQSNQILCMSHTNI